jgi:hypothetical protein
LIGAGISVEGDSMHTLRGRNHRVSGSAVLGEPSNDAAACLARATECELQAARITDSSAKQSFLDLADRWRWIAATFEYIERVDSFLAKPRS